jgi:hypothetical protein
MSKSLSKKIQYVKEFRTEESISQELQNDCDFNHINNQIFLPSAVQLLIHSIPKGLEEKISGSCNSFFTFILTTIDESLSNFTNDLHLDISLIGSNAELNIAMGRVSSVVCCRL